MSRGLGDVISNLLAATFMCAEIFFKICGNWVMRMSLKRSSGSSRGTVGVLPDTFPIVSGNKLHQLLVLSENLLHNLFSSCCNWWCRIFRWVDVYHIFLVFKFCRNAYYGVFNKILFSVASLFEGQFSGLDKVLMGFAKICFERDPCFMDRRKMILGLDRLSGFYCLVDNIIGLRDCIRLVIETTFHVPVLDKVFNSVENVAEWSYGVIIHFCCFFFEIVQMTQ